MATFLSNTLALAALLQAPAAAQAPVNGTAADSLPALREHLARDSTDGRAWLPYHFRYKPQNEWERPGIYAPYQPRFDWNLWFASLAPWQQNPWIVLTEQRLIQRSPSVLALFRDDPFHGQSPNMVRTMIYQYWFTDLATKHKTGAWWRRQELGEFSPAVQRDATSR